MSTERSLRTLADVIAFLATAQLGHGFPVPMFTEVVGDTGDGGRAGMTFFLTARMRVRDRDSGESTDVYCSELLFLPTSNHDIVMRHTMLLKKLLEHELVENYYIAGHRVLDPHRGGK